MKTTSRFWKAYRLVLISLLVLMAAFFIFFYDYIGAYEKSQPVYAAEQYASSLTQEDWRALYRENVTQSSTVLESVDRIADAYIQASEMLEGDIGVLPDHASSTADLWKYFITKNDTAIASVSVKAESGGKYGFSSWRVDSAHVITEHLPVASSDYGILVPKDSTVTVNGHELDSLYMSELDMDCMFAHPLEKHIRSAYEMYTVTGLLAVPDVQCVWNGAVCSGELEGGVWHFAYPTSTLHTYTIVAPTDAVVQLNGYVLDDLYKMQSGRAYAYSPYDATDVNLPTETEYCVEDLVGTPQIRVTMDGIVLDGALDGTQYYYPYPEELLYQQILCVPQNSIVSVNGRTLDAEHRGNKIMAYEELLADAGDPIYMDTYVLSGLYGVSDTVSVTLNGKELITHSTEEGRVVTCRAAYPDSTNGDVRSLALSFCKDYFAYTAGGYRNTEENLNRVLAYMIPNSGLYRRIARSKESVGFVTPVSKQLFHRLDVDTMEELSDSLVVCSISYDIEQWTYQVKRTYSGKLWLSMEHHDGVWVITHMLTDIK